MKTMTEFKNTNQGKIFILKHTRPTPTLLAFNGIEDLKNYVFADFNSKKILYDRITNTPAGHVFLSDQCKTKDIDKLEGELYQYADKYSLIEAASHDAENFILIDPDNMDSGYWNQLQDKQSSLYPHSQESAFDLISKLINEA